METSPTSGEKVCFGDVTFNDVSKMVSGMVHTALTHPLEEESGFLYVRQRGECRRTLEKGTGQCRARLQC